MAASELPTRKYWREVSRLDMQLWRKASAQLDSPNQRDLKWNAGGIAYYWTSTRIIGGLATDTIIGGFDSSLPVEGQNLVKAYCLYRTSPLVIVVNPQRLLKCGLHTAYTNSSVFNDIEQPSGNSAAVEAQVALGLHLMEQEDFVTMRELFCQAVDLSVDIERQ